MGDARSHTPNENHLRRNARLRDSRSPDLLLRLQVQLLSESGGSDDITRTGTNSSVAATAAAGAPGISRTGTGSTT
jgi:hypothetical protein